MAAFASHLFLPNVEPEVRASKNKLNSVRTEIADCNYLLKELALNNNVETYKSPFEIAKTIDWLKELESKYSTEYKTIRSNARISGFPSRHLFIYNFSKALLICLFSIQVLILLYRYKPKNHEAQKFQAVTFGAIGFFLVAWIFYPENDLPPKAYRVLLSSLGVSGSLMVFFAIKYRESYADNLKVIIQYLNNVIITIIPKRIKNIPVNEYEEIVWDALEYQTNEG